MLILKLILPLTLFFPFPCNSQIVKSVVLDSVVVQAVKKGFDVADFIEMVKADTSFLKAFRVIRNAPHTLNSDMKVYGNKNKVVATRKQIAHQVTNDKKRWIEISNESITGKFYDRKNIPELYTVEIFDNIFLYKDTMPVLPLTKSISSTTNTNNSSNINKLKQLIFNPGSQVDGVPVIGKRIAIFDEHMEPYYDYTIKVENFNDSVSCYVFSCKVKSLSDDYPVIKSLNTWFDRKTFNIVYREYQMQYSGMLFDFDVSMKVVMNLSETNPYPTRIKYAGYWDLPFKKKEKVDFTLDLKTNRQY